MSLQRNPDIKLYGLPWVWPGWLGGGKFNPYSNITNTVKYITNWITGAKNSHNLTINYIGVRELDGVFSFDWLQRNFWISCYIEINEKVKF